MNAHAACLSIICVGSISAISLTSSQLYRKEPLITSELMAAVSFLAGFFCAAIAAWNLPFDLDGSALVALLIKNILYCLSFYFRYESLRIFGSFVGALMLGAQPIIIFVLGSILLGEGLTSMQTTSMVFASAGVLLLARKDKNASEGLKIDLINFGKYFVFPALASALAMIWDRQFLRGEISGDEFFIFDRLMVVPAFIIVLGLVRGNNFMTAIWSTESSAVLTRNWKLLSAIGILFTVSVYTYNLVLEIEKAALVSLVRNVSYPIAAFIGAFIFQQRISVMKWLSLSLVLLSVFLGVV